MTPRPCFPKHGQNLVKVYKLGQNSPIFFFKTYLRSSYLVEFKYFHHRFRTFKLSKKGQHPSFHLGIQASQMFCLNQPTHIESTLQPSVSKFFFRLSFGILQHIIGISDIDMLRFQIINTTNLIQVLQNFYSIQKNRTYSSKQMRHLSL